MAVGCTFFCTLICNVRPVRGGHKKSLPAMLRGLVCEIRFLYHKCTHETENRVELRKGGVDQGVGEHIVTLADADDTVCCNLTLTDSGEHTY